MKHVPAKGPTVKGIDTSHYQQNVDFGRVVNAGYKFCFIKASEGVFTKDKSFKINWAGAKLNKIERRGAYHFFHPNLDPKEQANNFVNAVGPLDPLDILALDLEVTDGTAPNIDYQRVKTFMNQVELMTKKVPILYSGAYFMESLGIHPDMLKYKLWVAHYGPSEAQGPLVPKPWDDWTFWQYTCKAQVPGVMGLCDASYFNGSLEDLKAL